MVQRELRDHFMAHAEQMNLSLKESLRAAERSVESTTADRNAGSTEIVAELARLEELQKQVRTLLAPPQRSGTRKSTGTTPPEGAGGRGEGGRGEVGPRSQTSERSRPNSSLREVTPRRPRMRATWCSTVLAEMNSCSPICL